MRKHISPATVIASLALFFSLTGAGMAASGYRITSLWQLAPKVRHALRGAVGPQGVPGPTGPQGPAGPTLGLEEGEGDQVTIAPGQTGYSQAQCFHTTRNYYWAESGRYIADPGAQIYDTEDQGSGQWLVQAYNPTDHPVKLQAWVECLTSPVPPPDAPTG